MPQFNDLSLETRVVLKLADEVLKLGSKPSKSPGFMEQKETRGEFRAHWDAMTQFEQQKTLERLGPDGVMDALSTGRGAEPGFRRLVKPASPKKTFGA